MHNPTDRHTPLHKHSVHNKEQVGQCLNKITQILSILLSLKPRLYFLASLALNSLDLYNIVQNLEATSANIKLLEDKQIELENLRKHKINGYITRTRMQWLQEDEKPSSFFCNLEKRNYVEKNNKKVATPNWHGFKYSKRNSARG